MTLQNLSPDACYRAMTSHDARFDGHFFVGVRSTRVYCRPICRVRLPKRQNCSFHPSAAAAEVAGFRPCLKCRPELAPGVGASEASRSLAWAAARMIESGIAGEFHLAAIARRLGVTDRHMRRIFTSEFGVSPVQFAQTQRLLLAKRFLTDTALPVAQVAFASGFSSVRRLNALFAQRYGFAPTRLRKEARSGMPAGEDALVFFLPYRPPYDFERLLGFLEARAVPGVESIAEGAYRRVVRIGAGANAGQPGWLEVSHLSARGGLRLRFDARLAGATQAILCRVRQVFDVDADPWVIDRALGRLAQGASGLRLPGAFDGFEIALRAILGQQVTVKAARTLSHRFVDAFGDPVATPFAELTRAFPAPAAVARLRRDDIGALGIIGQRAQAMIELARAVAAGAVDLQPGADPARAVERLCGIGGIGPWTAHYIAMRALAWPDAWLPNDVALRKALDLPDTAAGRSRAQALSEAWQPWRSYAVLHLWRRLERTATLETTQ
jgi:AraC family transcriptional regulator, regulatory protein of adaptative response / DNA-3-methyladenine glycosylase II